MTTNNPQKTQTHHVPLPDGRVLAVDDTRQENANSDGPVVVFLHCAPGSRVFDPDPGATAAAGVRLLTFDRPGYGESSPPPDGVPTFASIGDDLAAALAHLDISEVAVAGWSYGGLGALALAARHPDLVRAAALLATPALDDDVPWLPDEYRAAIHQIRQDPGTALEQMTEMLAPIAAAPAAGIASVAGGDADERILATGDNRGRMERMIEVGLRNGTVGAARDVVAANVAPWGFDPRAIGVPVHLFYGEDDVAVTPAHAAWWAGVLADPHRHDVAGAGHLVPLVVWRDVLAYLTGSGDAPR
jgi:pimeloyl-ACP methyl ester carboxylesterase